MGSGKCGAAQAGLERLFAHFSRACILSGRGRVRWQPRKLPAGCIASTRRSAFSPEPKMRELGFSDVRRVGDGSGWVQMAEQAPVLGKYCAHALADYCSALAQVEAPLPRSVLAMLQSGAFALMDACGPLDLQNLHAALGSGGEEGTLAVGGGNERVLSNMLIC